MKDMPSSKLFAIEKISIDPETSSMINGVGLFVMGALLIILTGLLFWHFTPMLLGHYRDKRNAKVEANRDFWFDAEESILHRGSRQLKIPIFTLEYFVCKLVFEERNKHQLDINILEAFGGDSLKERPVYFAVVRLNKKVRSELQLKEDLFVYEKQRTALNNNYR